MPPVVRVKSALIVAAAVVGAAASLCPARGFCETDTIREAMGAAVSQGAHVHEHPPVVGRYLSETGATFILDRSGPSALFRFERSPEVWALHATPGPGGDIIYKNDLDQPVVRISRLGGLTVFTPQRPMGAAATLQGEGAPFHPPALSAQALLQIMIRDSARASRSADRLIPFNADASPGSEFVMADAAGIAAEALVQMASIREGRPLVDRVKQVRLSVGRHVDVRFRSGVVSITVDPRSGLAGRPSSGRIARAIVDGSEP
jgi:Domain of unknown function (DUF4908)